MEGITQEKKPRDKTAPPSSIAQVTHVGPNIIGNAPVDVPVIRSSTLNKGSVRITAGNATEERKASQTDKSAELAKVTMSQFMRNIKSRDDLLYALSIKGK